VIADVDDHDNRQDTEIYLSNKIAFDLRRDFWTIRPICLHDGLRLADGGILNPCVMCIRVDAKALLIAAVPHHE
jgi:hypothetical protein